MLSDACADFLLELLGVRLDSTDRLWFFSDWATVVPRTFEERFWDLCVSRGVYARSVPLSQFAQGAQ